VELAPRLKTALGTLAQGLDERFDPALTRRRFALALSEADQACSAPEIAAALTKRMPNAALQIVNLDTIAANDGLATGLIDAAIAPALSWPAGPNTYAKSLHEEEGVLLVRKSHRMARRGRISADQFNALRHVDAWLVLGRPSLGHRVAEDYFARHGMKREVALVVPNFFTAAMIAAATSPAPSLVGWRSGFERCWPCGSSLSGIPHCASNSASSGANESTGIPVPRRFGSWSARSCAAHGAPPYRADDAQGAFARCSSSTTGGRRRPGRRK
jgi:hypothetical protein